jgi:outer membrane protein assembly factor BamD
MINHLYKFTLSGLLHSLLLSSALFLQACSGLDADITADWSAKDFYDEARQSLDAGEFQTAIKNLETLEARFPFDPYAKQAQLDIAYAYYKFDEPESAISAVNRFMRLHPRDPHIDYAYYIKGLINFNRGTGFLDSWIKRDPAHHDADVMRSAFNDFSTLVRRFPNSHYAGDAHQRMIYLRNKLAQKEINVAEYYIERGTWLSAANRAKAVIETYQDSIWSVRALEIMVTAYTNLGLEDLAVDAERVLSMNNLTPRKDQPREQLDDKIDSPPTIARSY